MMSEPMFRKGHEFHGPDGQGYRLTCDVFRHEQLKAWQFEAFGGAPEPEPGHALPSWLWDQLEAAVKAPRP